MAKKKYQYSTVNAPYAIVKLQYLKKVKSFFLDAFSGGFISVQDLGVAMGHAESLEAMLSKWYNEGDLKEWRENHKEVWLI